MTNKTQKSKQIRNNWVQMDTLCCGTGWDEADLANPQILVEDVFGSSHPGSIHLDTLAEEVSIGIYQNGGKPANFHGTDICDGWAMSHDGMNFILPSREVLCDLVEVHGRVIPWDGLVVISSCDKSVPAHLMAAARLNIPAIHIPGGSNRAGPDMSHSLLVGELATRMRQGEDVVPEIRNYKLSGCPGAGACQFMGTASTMQCMAEALGMALPGSALAPVSLFEIRRLARRAGRQIMQLSQKGIRPADILTPEAFENAIKVHAALSGSTNALLHLPAIAHELGIDIDAQSFDRINRETPYIVDVQPSGKYVTEMVWYAGGVPRVQIELADILDLDVMTVTGHTLGENLDRLKTEGFFQRCEGYLANYRLKREEVIHRVDDNKGFGSIAVLKGNIAPEGAVVKFSAVGPDMLTHEGPARVFDREEAALAAVMNGRIDPGSVIVLRYEGPRGSGMPEMLATTEALVTNPKLQHTAIVTDGRFSGATRGPCIGHVSPEAVAGGPIALVEDDDLLSIDIPGRNLNIVGHADRRMNPAEVQALLAERKKQWKAPSLVHPRGVLKRYVNQAVSAIKGAYLE
ncbi:MAG: dihydroxy-acid dehydratase [Desulfobacteraceae bacterium]|jgi:dihydroxy-acid dehydratase|nr:dihydroxy-acid dehydratase [Desulfobacteraceae bacterium]